MTQIDDCDRRLLEQFNHAKADDAFAALVKRHINFVYSAAMRQVGYRSDLAEDVTQAVFILLARKSNSVKSSALAGWLFNTTRYAAKNAMRSETLRAFHERRAAEARSTQTSKEAEWPGVADVLDEAVARLKHGERDVVLLHYFRGQTLIETAATLGITPQAARKRSSRAIEKLRKFFTSRGLLVSEAGLSAMITKHSIQSTPASLISREVSVSTTSIVKGVIQMKMLTGLKVASAAAAIVISTVILAVVTVQKSSGSQPSAPAVADMSNVTAILTQRLYGGSVMGNRLEIDELIRKDGLAAKYFRRGSSTSVDLQDGQERLRFRAGGDLVAVGPPRLPADSFAELANAFSQLPPKAVRDESKDTVLYGETIRAFQGEQQGFVQPVVYWLDQQSRLRQRFELAREISVMTEMSYDPPADPIKFPTTRPAGAQVVALEGMLAKAFPLETAIFTLDQGSVRFAVHELKPLAGGAFSMISSARFIDPEIQKRHYQAQLNFHISNELIFDMHVYEEDRFSAPGSVRVGGKDEVESLGRLTDPTASVYFSIVFPTGTAVTDTQRRFLADIRFNSAGAEAQKILKPTGERFRFALEAETSNPGSVDEFLAEVHRLVYRYEPLCDGYLDSGTGQENLQTSDGHSIIPTARPGEIDKDQYIANTKTRLGPRFTATRSPR